ncbi:hypothetical protein KDX20_21475 [Burkholderia cenocepacia]|uniref:hypothetical protein n=1 Tax=Burkholderia cenocepacia TaxID=95486 RepID=UPI001BA30636|nr:hypothetical protein [Burkholderia cenocepacia]MBR8157008.1 hypothetical protein [Burkholderia cenocepacia]
MTKIRRLNWLAGSSPVPGTIDCVDAIRFDEGVKNPREMQRSRVFFVWRGYMKRLASAARDTLHCTENGAM